MVSAENKVKRLSLVNHTTKKIIIILQSSNHGPFCLIDNYKLGYISERNLFLNQAMSKALMCSSSEIDCIEHY